MTISMRPIVAARGTYRIILLIEGEARVSTSLADIDLHLGTAAVLAAEDPSAVVTVTGRAAVITSGTVATVGA